jgi:hypothetical protein
MSAVLDAVYKKSVWLEGIKSKACKGTGGPHGIKLSILLSLDMAHFAADR